MRVFTLRRWLTLLAVTTAVFLVLLSGVAGAFSSPKVTVSETIGGVPTRFTFEGVIDPGDSMTELDLTFPDGFDLSKVRVESLTLDGLNRVPVEPKVTITGQSVNLAFDPAVESGSKVLTLRVVTYEVMTPNTGATYTLKASYVDGGATVDIPGLTFSYASPSAADSISRWLDEQGWVRWLNDIKAVNLFLQPQLIVRAIPLLFWGWMMSIALVLVAFPLAIVVGLLWSFAKMSKIPPLRWLASAYINVIRGTPLFLQIFIFFIGFRIAGIRMNDFITAIIVLAMNSSAYLAEIFRAGIQSIHKGQMEAAVSLGLNYAQSMRYVIIPQTVKRVLPTMTSEFILLFKDTALLSAVGIFELMLRANNFVARVGNLTPYVVAALYYLVVTIPLINYVGRLERRLAVAEGGQVTGGRKPRGALLPSSDTAGEVK